MELPKFNLKEPVPPRVTLCRYMDVELDYKPSFGQVLEAFKEKYPDVEFKIEDIAFEHSGQDMYDDYYYEFDYYLECPNPNYEQEMADYPAAKANYDKLKAEHDVAARLYYEELSKQEKERRIEEAKKVLKSAGITSIE